MAKSKNNENPDINKFKEWLKQLHYEVVDLNSSCIIWETLTEIENHSAHFKQYGGHFQYWQNQNFFYKTIIQVSRLTEQGTKKDDRSFIKFLVELRDKRVISFNQFRKNWSDSFVSSAGLTEESLIKDFEEITNQKYTDLCFCRMINEDLQELQKIHQEIRVIRNKIIAHLTKPQKKCQILNIPK